MKAFLDPLFERFHRPEYLNSDPVEFVHRYSDPWDQEVVAIVAATLAYGNVRQIRRSVEELLRRIQIECAEGPAAFVRGLGQGFSREGMLKAFEGYAHRFNVGEDLAILLILVHKSWETFGSVGAHFLRHLPRNAPNIEAGLDGLMRDWRSWEPSVREELDLEPRDSFQYLLTAPEDGSCCKRWCMFLRWMVRSDSIDLGLWQECGGLSRTFPKGQGILPGQLVIPLDTHTGRISGYLGLTRRRSLNWKAALEVTENLRKADPEDPVKYDFALSRLGILALCQKRYRVEICSRCELLAGCRFAKKKMKQKVP